MQINTRNPGDSQKIRDFLTTAKTVVLLCFSGAWSDNVDAVWRPRWPLERRNHRLSVSDGQSAVPGADPAATQGLLREKRQPRTKVRPTFLWFSPDACVVIDFVAPVFQTLTQKTRTTKAKTEVHGLLCGKLWLFVAQRSKLALCNASKSSAAVRPAQWKKRKRKKISLTLIYFFARTDGKLQNTRFCNAAKFQFPQGSHIWNFCSIPSGTSPDLKHLLYGMLKRNAKDRIKFDDFFKHKFLRRKIPNTCELFSWAYLVHHTWMPQLLCWIGW